MCYWNNEGQNHWCRTHNAVGVVHTIPVGWVILVCVFHCCQRNKVCAWRHDMPPPLSSPVGAQWPRAPPSRRDVAVVSHAQYVFTVTAAPVSRVKAAVSEAAWWPWPLTFWPWKWCPSHVTWATSVPTLVFLGFSVLELGPMNATDRLRTDVRQKHRLMPPPIRGGGIITGSW